MKKKHIDSIKRGIGLGILISLLLILILVLGRQTRLYSLYLSSGASQEPYCLNCLGFYVSMEPRVNDQIVYFSKFKEDTFLLQHPLIFKNETNYFACANPYKEKCLGVDTINKEDYIGKVVFELKLETTQDFMIACLKELDDIKIENKIKYCLEWEGGYRKFKYETDN